MAEMRKTTQFAAVLRFLFFAILACGSVAGSLAADAADSGRRLLFTSQGKTAMIRSDSGGPRVFEFDVPNQATWQPGPLFADGKRIVFLSMEPRRDGPGKPFEEYYTQTPTHIWAHDLASGSLQELCTKNRLAPFETPALLIGDERLLVQVVKDRVGRIVSMRLDGSDARDFTKPGEGLPYGLSLRPDGRRVAFHLAGPEGYQIWTCAPDGQDRVKIKAEAGHLFFGTSWSPDGQWILYVDCIPASDPGHDWCDVCIGRADGSEHRRLTEGMAMWFAATYGPAHARGGGSNLPAWTSDGKILFPRRMPGSKVPWEYRVGKPDLDHFNRDYKPESARGGVQIGRLDPQTGKVAPLTAGRPNLWDFRASESPDGKEVAFCRAETGGSPAIWIMDADGTNARPITKGISDKGCDHPRWLPLRK
jgi:TolB protein